MSIVEHKKLRHPNPIIHEDIQETLKSYDFWGELKNARIFITGASGFIASYAIETLLALNKSHGYQIRVFALARNSEKFWSRFEHHKEDSNLIFIHQDVVDDLSSLNIHYFTHIIHAASHASPAMYNVDPVGIIDANTLGTRQILALAREANSASVLFISSAEIYGEPNHIPTSESDYGYLDPTVLRSCYGESKRSGEAMCIAWERQFNVPVRIVRPFHTYGPGMSLNDGRVFADFVKNVVACEPITINSAGTAKRAFCYLTDAVGGIFTVLLHGKVAEPYNLGNEENEISIFDLAKLLQRMFPERTPKVLVNAQDDTQSTSKNRYIASQISRACPDTTKIKALGWKPVTDITKGFKRTIESYLYEP